MTQTSIEKIEVSGGNLCLIIMLRSIEDDGRVDQTITEI